MRPLTSKVKRCVTAAIFAGAGWVMPHLAAEVPPPFAGNDFNKIWSAPLGNNFTESEYQKALEALLREYLEAGGYPLEPGEFRRVGIKLYTYSGSGLHTPKALTRAVINVLLESGFNREDLFLLDINTSRLRRSGYLPPLSRMENKFDGIEILALDSGDFFDPEWHYDSPLPAEEPRPTRFFELPRNDGLPEDRRSMLPTPLLFDIDFWINLPVLSDHPTLGISGALANATVWNVSNSGRFLLSPSSASVAVAELAAIPELNRAWVFSIISLERYQYMGGPIFNSLYTRSVPSLLLSTNPAAMDYHLLERINRARLSAGFRTVNPPPRMFEYFRNLELGDFETPRIIEVELEAKTEN